MNDELLTQLAQNRRRMENCIKVIRVCVAVNAVCLLVLATVTAIR